MKQKAVNSRELTVRQCLKNISPLIDNKYKIIKFIHQIYEHNDDPKFYHYAAQLFPATEDGKDDEASNSVGGFSFKSDEDALLKCLGEAIERHAMRKIHDNKTINSRYKDLKLNAVNPHKFVTFSDKQRKDKKFNNFNFDSNTDFKWVKGHDLINEQLILVPAQLVYLYPKLLKNEKWIYLPISTGSAGGSSRIASIVRAIYEVVERDAFLIYYLNKIPGKRISLEQTKDKDIITLWKKIQSYKLNVISLDISVETNISTILTIVLDETGIGPAVSLGLKSSFNIKEAIIGSMQESLHPRGWIRRNVQENPDLINKSINNPITLEQRALLWYPVSRIKDIKFMHEKSEIIKYEKFEKYSIESQFKKLKKIFEKNKMDLYCVDVTFPEAKKRGYYVSRVLIPQLYPFYLIEEFPYLGGDRLYDMPRNIGLMKKKNNEDTLNKIPHPFI